MARQRDTVTVYRDEQGQVRWRWRSSNGKVLGDSGQGYAEPRNCRTIARRLAEAVDADLIDAT